MYSAQVLDHFQNPRNAGEVQNADARVRIENPACGDILELTAKIAAERIVEIRFRAKGCVSAMACSSALTEMVAGRTLAEARAAIDRGKAFAAVDIPPGTERDVLKGITAHIPVYADATYLFVFRSTASGVATAIGTLTSDLVSRGARSDGSLVKAKLASMSPADVLLQPIFNPVGGYASYVVQDLVIRPHVILFRRQRWRAADGRMVTAPTMAQTPATPYSTP